MFVNELQRKILWVLELEVVEHHVHLCQAVQGVQDFRLDHQDQMGLVHLFFQVGLEAQVSH